MTGTCYRGITAAFLVLILFSCAAPRPILYPNAHYEQVGSAAAQGDIAYCRARADQHLESGGEVKKVAAGTAVGGGVGAAIGAVGGAVAGDAGEGAAIGAATGATVGLLGGLFGAGEPDPVYMNFVDRCLRERGYEPIGWR